jgi:AcrR family transcriptional regulator
MTEDSTRARVIDAAVACILEEGFYRASSNKIARRAGVTWGVIQYHFGTREALLLAVHERAVAELVECLTTAVITGDTVDARIRSLVDVLWSYYRRPEFLAYMQVMLNLSHDPTTEQQTRDALRSLQPRASVCIPRLVRDVMDGTASEARVADGTGFLFNVIRGLALDQQLLEATPIEPRPSRSALDAQRDALVRVLGRYLSG